MRLAMLIAVASVFIAAASASAAEWRRKSSANASACVSHTNGIWQISVKFHPVTSFEEGKNLLENHKIAQTIAEWGLLKELHASPTQTLEVSGLRKTSFSVGKDTVRAEFSVPLEDVRLVERKAAVHKQPAANVEIPDWPDSIVDVEIGDEEIEAILRRHPFFIKTGGAKILRLEDGRALIVSIGMTDAAKPAVARRTIAENKARSALAAHVNGVRVFTEKRLDEKTSATLSKHGEAAIELCESTERIKSESKGRLQGLDIIGTWIVKDENTFCLAIGRLIPADEVSQFVSTVQ